MSKLGLFIRLCIFLFLVYCLSGYYYFNWDVLCAQDAKDKILYLPFLVYCLLFYYILDMLLVEIPQILFDIEL